MPTNLISASMWERGGAEYCCNNIHTEIRTCWMHHFLRAFAERFSSFCQRLQPVCRFRLHTQMRRHPIQQEEFGGPGWGVGALKCNLADKKVFIKGRAALWSWTEALTHNRSHLWVLIPLKRGWTGQIEASLSNIQLLNPAAGTRFVLFIYISRVLW